MELYGYQDTNDFWKRNIYSTDIDNFDNKYKSLYREKTKVGE